MFCRKCRTIIPDDSIFCENCGAPTGLVPEELVDFSLSSEEEQEAVETFAEAEPFAEFETGKPSEEPDSETIDWYAEPEAEESAEELAWTEEPADEASPEEEFDWNAAPAEPEMAAEPEAVEPEVYVEPEPEIFAGSGSEAEAEPEAAVQRSSVPVDPVWWEPPHSAATRRMMEEEEAAIRAAAEAAEESGKVLPGEASESAKDGFHIDTEGLKQAAAAAVTQAKPYLEKAKSLMKDLGKNVRTGTGWAVGAARDQLRQMQEERSEKKAQQEQERQAEAEAREQAAAEDLQTDTWESEPDSWYEADGQAEERMPFEATDAIEEESAEAAADSAGDAVDTDEAADAIDTAEAEGSAEADSADEADETEPRRRHWKKSRQKEKAEEALRPPAEENVDQFLGFWYAEGTPEGAAPAEDGAAADAPMPAEDGAATDAPAWTEVDAPMPAEESRDVKLADTGVFHWFHRDIEETKAAARAKLDAQEAAVAAAASDTDAFAAVGTDTADPADAVDTEAGAAADPAGAAADPAGAAADPAGAAADPAGAAADPAGAAADPAGAAADPAAAEAAAEDVSAEAANLEADSPEAADTDIPEPAADPAFLDGYVGLPEGEEPAEPDEPSLYRIKNYSETRERVTIKKPRKGTKETMVKKPRREMTRRDWIIIGAIIAALILVGVIVGVQIHRIHEQKLADEAFAASVKQAHQLVDNKKYKDAEALFLQLIAERPEDVSSYVGLADMYVDQQRYQDAKALIKRGIRNTGDRESFQELKDEIKVLTSTVWKEEYIKVLEDNESDIRKYESRVQAPVAVCDVNGDLKPELFFFTMEYYGYGKLHIYTTVNDQAKEVEYDCKNRSTKYTDAFYDVAPNDSSYAIFNLTEDGEFAIYANNSYGGDSWDTINFYNLNLQGGCPRLHVMQGDIDTTYSDKEKDDSTYQMDGNDIEYNTYLENFKQMLESAQKVILYNGTGGDQSVWTKVKPKSVMCMSYDSIMVDLQADN